MPKTKAAAPPQEEFPPFLPCQYCGNDVPIDRDKKKALRKGRPIYCNKACSNKGRGVDIRARSGIPDKVPCTACGKPIPMEGSRRNAYAAGGQMCCNHTCQGVHLTTIDRAAKEAAGTPTTGTCHHCGRTDVPLTRQRRKALAEFRPIYCGNACHAQVKTIASAVAKAGVPDQLPCAVCTTPVPLDYSRKYDFLRGRRPTCSDKCKRALPRAHAPSLTPSSDNRGTDPP